MRPRPVSGEGALCLHRSVYLQATFGLLVLLFVMHGRVIGHWRRNSMRGRGEEERVGSARCRWEWPSLLAVARWQRWLRPPSPPPQHSSFLPPPASRTGRRGGEEPSSVITVLGIIMQANLLASLLPLHHFPVLYSYCTRAGARALIVMVIARTPGRGRALVQRLQDAGRRSDISFDISYFTLVHISPGAWGVVIEGSVPSSFRLPADLHIRAGTRVHFLHTR